MEGHSGILYGVGVGPGDPELVTLKAKNILERCPVLAVPATHKGNALALEIVKGVADISGKKLLTLPFPMSADETETAANHKVQAARVAEILKSGEDVAFACLGDVSVYSTFSYIGELVKGAGYPVRMVPGITSFCAAACALGISLTELKSPLHIIPGVFGAAPDTLALPGVKVLMKSAGRFSELRRAVMDSGQSAWAVSDCGLAGERLYERLEDMPEDPGYFTTVIVKERL
jgi:precorrin-2/cobalt-factor-2 C20-methyltransferase